jgi:hypothetical protein
LWAAKTRGEELVDWVLGIRTKEQALQLSLNIIRTA